MIKYKLLKNDGIIIIETEDKDRDIESLKDIDVDIYDTRKYGIVFIIFIRKG